MKKDKEKTENTKKSTKKSSKKVNVNTQEYVDKMVAKKKRNFKIIVAILILLILVVAVLTVFAIKTSVSNKIISGISINGVDISGLTVKEAENKINKQIEDTLLEEIDMEYDEFETTVAREDLDIELKVEDAVKAAYEIGRQDNIIENNFKVITTFINKTNIDMEMNYNEEMLDSIITDIRQSLPGLTSEYTYCIEDDELIITSGKKGIVLDEENTRSIILDRFAGNILTKDESTVTIPVVEKEPEKIDLEKIYEEIYSEPQDAYIVEDPLEIVVDKSGVDFAITMEEAQSIIDEEEKDEYIIPLKITAASVTVKSLGSKAFPDQLSKYTTKYDASNKNRSTNLELAASKINGTVLLAGEEFSYNKVVGKRTIENGYKEAAIYADGGVQDGVGGGICQISTTLYNAVLLANLEITERKNHTYVTSYEDPGRDATVVYGYQDFKFVNTREYPIKLVASVKNGVATIKIMGIKEEEEYTVKIRAYTTETIKYKTETIENSSMYEGEEKVKQKGTYGYKAVCYRDLYLNGKKISSELISTDTYSAMKRIVEVGTKKKKTTTTKEDTSSSTSSDTTTSSDDTNTDETDDSSDTSGDDE